MSASKINSYLLSEICSLEYVKLQVHRFDQKEQIGINTKLIEMSIIYAHWAKCSGLLI